MSRSILVVAAHPDDELLGCGGTLVRHAKDGDRVHILIMATGATSRDSGDEAGIAALEKAAAAAASRIGAEPPRFAGFPDNAMDSVELLRIVKAVEEVVDEISPHIVYTHHGGDLNIDHVLTHRAVLTACRPLPDASIEAVYAFETLSSSEWGSADIDPPFRPQHYVDIADTLPAKLVALGAYASEMRPFPHPRSDQAVEALARVRGSEAGVAAAEAFSVLLQVRR
jgi:LmbE family N-acetylglucosaminyl deacetylase